VDRDLRIALRVVYQSGREETLLRELMLGCRNPDKQYKYARWLNERVQKRWGPRGSRVAVKFLTDETLLRLINERVAISRWNNVQRFGLGTWDDRNVHDIVLDEAEGRGLISDEQEWWLAIQAMTPRAQGNEIRRIIHIRCCGKVEYEFLQDEYVCINCRHRVTYAKVFDTITRMCAKRLW